MFSKCLLKISRKSYTLFVAAMVLLSVSYAESKESIPSNIILANTYQDHNGFEGQAGVLGMEFIYEKASFPQCHASTIVETKDGLVAAWFGGKHERNPDVCIWISRLTSEGWTEPVEAADGVQNPDLRYPCWNPVLL